MIEEKLENLNICSPKELKRTEWELISELTPGQSDYYLGCERHNRQKEVPGTQDNWN